MSARTDRAAIVVVAVLVLVFIGAAVGLAVYRELQPPDWTLPQHGSIACYTARLGAEAAHQDGQHLDATPGPCIP